MRAGALRAGVVSALLACSVASARTAPVEKAIVRDVAHARGTVVLVHAGGWSGPDRQRQWDLDWWPGRMFREAGWSTASIDYAAGQAGLASVSEQLAAAMARTPGWPVCAYGESAGGHLALLAAAALPGLRCVITMGAPTDLERWRDDAAVEGRGTSLGVYGETVVPTFGGGPIDDRWEPAVQAPRVRARVLLVGQGDDQVLPIAGQLQAFADALPRTEVDVTPPGDYADPDQRYLHGTLSPAARGDLEARMRAFLAPVARFVRLRRGRDRLARAR